MEYKITIDLQKTKNIKAINIGAGNMKKRVSLVIVFNNNDEVVIKLSKYVPFDKEANFSNRLYDPIFLENKKENQDCTLILMPIRP